MFQDIKNYFFQKRLNSELMDSNPKLCLMNYQDTKEIGVVFDATEMSTILVVRDFELKMKQEGKQVHVYGYMNTNDPKTDMNIVTNKNLNWYGYPTKTTLFDFARKEFDVLLGIFNEVNSPLNAIFANSKSKLRIGLNYNQDDRLFDIMLASSKIKNSKDIINVLTDFLTTVRTK